MSDSISVTTSDVNIDTPDLGAAGNGAGTAIDTTALFTISTFSSDNYQTAATSFELGSPVYTKIDGAGMSSLPTDIIWAANGCTVRTQSVSFATSFDNFEHTLIYLNGALF